MASIRIRQGSLNNQHFWAFPDESDCTPETTAAPSVVTATDNDGSDTQSIDLNTGGGRETISESLSAEFSEIDTPCLGRMAVEFPPNKGMVFTKRAQTDNSIRDKVRPSIAIGVEGIRCFYGEHPAIGSINFWAAASNIQKSAFDVHLINGSGTRPKEPITSLNLSWIEVLPTHESWILQGEQSVLFNPDPEKMDDRSWSVVEFEDGIFLEPPEVVVWISGLNSGCKYPTTNGILSIAVRPVDITTSGYKLAITIGKDTNVRNMKVTWIAYNKRCPNVCSGSASSTDIRAFDRPQNHDRDYVTFPERVEFERGERPNVALGMNKIAVKTTQSIGVELKVAKVNNMGFVWTADAAEGTIMHDVGFSYIAIRDFPM